MTRARVTGAGSISASGLLALHGPLWPHLSSPMAPPNTLLERAAKAGASPSNPFRSPDVPPLADASPGSMEHTAGSPRYYRHVTALVPLMRTFTVTWCWSASALQIIWVARYRTLYSHRTFHIAPCGVADCGTIPY